MSIKSKILSVLKDTDLSDIGEECLIDILVDKIKSQEKKIELLKGENSHERLVLQTLEEKVKLEYQEIYRNHNKLKYDTNFFVGQRDKKFMVTFNLGICELVEWSDKYNYKARRVSPAEFEKIK